jgi:hypothetical protein
MLGLLVRVSFSLSLQMNPEANMMPHFLNQTPNTHWHAPSPDILKINCACQIVPFIPSSSLQIQQGIPDSFHPGFPAVFPITSHDSALLTTNHTCTPGPPHYDYPHSIPPPTPRNASPRKPTENSQPTRRVPNEAGNGIRPIVVFRTSQSRTCQAVPISSSSIRSDS